MTGRLRAGAAGGSMGGFEDAGHATAPGKCVLRGLDDESRRDYLSRHPPADLTPRRVRPTG